MCPWCRSAGCAHRDGAPGLGPGPGGSRGRPPGLALFQLRGQCQCQRHRPPAPALGRPVLSGPGLFGPESTFKLSSTQAASGAQRHWQGVSASRHDPPSHSVARHTPGGRRHWPAGPMCQCTARPGTVTQQWHCLRSGAAAAARAFKARNQRRGRGGRACNCQWYSVALAESQRRLSGPLEARVAGATGSVTVLFKLVSRCQFTRVWHRDRHLTSRGPPLAMALRLRLSGALSRSEFKLEACPGQP
jgi:hypothetical protein